MHIGHPVLVPEKIAFRGYQVNLARIASRQDSLVVLPTGMGKTVVALLVLADALRDGAERLLVLAPTRPLVEQHAEFLRGALRAPWAERVHALTGHVAPEARQAAYAVPGVVVATPQAVHNDLVNGRLDLRACQWVVFDECHRAVGDYPYTFIGQELRRVAPKVRRLGLTASPGHDVQKIDEVRTHLGLAHVEIRTPSDPDVAEYVQDVGVEWEALPLPPGMARCAAKLHEALAERVRALKTIGFLKGVGNRPRRRDLLEVAQKAQAALQRAKEPDPALYQALSLQAQAMKIQHAIEQAETQGAAGLVEYLASLREEAAGSGASKATRSVVEDERVSEAFHVARLQSEENPKLERVSTLVQQQLERDADARVIVFTQYRSTCEALAQRLARVAGARPAVFVGQGRRRGQSGLTQKQQAEVLERFRAGAHNVLVATSVAEEGLDIPETDLVVFYEPIASEIRSIQRRGRTGRHREGRVVVLMTKGTQDEAAHWSARRKETQMVQELHGLRGALALRAAGRSADAAAGTDAAHAGAAQRRLDDVPASRSSAASAAPSASRTVPSASTAPPSVSASAPSPPVPSPTAPSAPVPSALPPAQAPSAAPPPARAPAATAPGLLPGPRIVVDSREQNGGVVRHLHDLGAQVEARRLDIADYVLSDRVAVERKDTRDFVDSLVDGRLFDQLKALRTYPRGFLVIEGESLYGHRNVAPEALLGALASAAVDFGIPVVRTQDPLETARFLLAVAKREQGRDGRRVAVRPGGGPMDDDERQRHLVAGLPGVSEARAEALLSHFGSAAAVFAATAEELAQVDLIGPRTAAEIRRVLDAPYRAPAGAWPDARGRSEG